MQQSDTAVISFDKDDKACLDFVTSVSNFRAHVFGIPLTSRFSVKGKTQVAKSSETLLTGIGISYGRQYYSRNSHHQRHHRGIHGARGVENCGRTAGSLRDGPWSSTDESALFLTSL